MPELQGRLPIRVELKALNHNDFVRILTEPKANLIEQKAIFFAGIKEAYAILNAQKTIE